MVWGWQEKKEYGNCYSLYRVSGFRLWKMGECVAGQLLLGSRHSRCKNLKFRGCRVWAGGVFQGWRVQCGGVQLSSNGAMGIEWKNGTDMENW